MTSHLVRFTIILEPQALFYTMTGSGHMPTHSGLVTRASPQLSPTTNGQEPDAQTTSEAATVSGETQRRRLLWTISVSTLLGGAALQLLTMSGQTPVDSPLLMPWWVLTPEGLWAALDRTCASG